MLSYCAGTWLQELEEDIGRNTAYQVENVDDLRLEKMVAIRVGLEGRSAKASLEVGADSWHL
jgi:hypothetical protein